jgi:TonB family protein
MIRRLFFAASLLVCPALAGAQDGLDSVRELYASAEYEGALSAIGRLKEDPVAASSLEIDRYRVLCLFALGRANEAEQVIQAIVTNDPLYEPAPADAPPRIRAAFGDVRKRVLPGVVRGMYTEAKAAYDRKALPEAIAKLENTIRVIDSVEPFPRPELADLRTLASGFLDLSRASLPPPAPVAPPPARVSEPKAAASVITSDPVAIRQVFPPWSIAIAGSLFEAEFRGAVEIDIDEHGAVVGALIAEPVHPAYDQLLLKAARDWKYEPARRAGVPVRVKKRVDVVLRPR